MTRTHNYYPQNVTITDASSIKVYNLTSPRSGEPVRNQFVIRCYGMATRFQSYDTTCLKWDSLCKVLTVFPEAFRYSVTTSKYSKVFLHDECGFHDNEVDAIARMAKREDYGWDCPLYIQF